MTPTNEVRIETSTLCNHKCKFCPQETYFHRKREIMSTDLFKFLLQKVKFELPQITDLTISGMGELFIDSDIVAKLEYGKSLGYKTHLLTNGTLISKQMIDDIADLVYDIRFSLHSNNKEDFIKLTGTSEKEFNNVREIIDYTIEKGIRTVITADVIDINKDHVDELIAEYKDRVDLLEIWKPHNWTNWNTFRESHRDKLTCGRPENGPLQIQVDGTVNMCCFDYDGKLEFGDFKTQSINEMYNSDFYKQIVAQHKTMDIIEPQILCVECDQLSNVRDVVIFNSKFDGEDRVGRLSTTYEDVEE